MVILERSHLQQFLSAIQKRSYRIIGPTQRGTAIVLDEISSADDLPAGWGDEQRPASYRLRRNDDKRLFGHAAGPESWKKFLFPPSLNLFSGRRAGKSFEVISPQNGRNTGAADEKIVPLAFFGMRACDLQALRIHDAVFMNCAYPDPYYRSRRERLLIVAVTCSSAGGTCFCDSMGTGPGVGEGFDLALTEVEEEGRHYFLTEVGSPRGTDVMNDVPRSKATQADIDHARKLVANARAGMKRSLSQDGLRDFLSENLDSGYWDEVARRCLMCANCTLVCPTCFCSTIEDTTDLSGEHAERWRRWDSCFTMDFAKVTGGNFRPSPRARYRQWLTHKFSSWIEQFGTAGCVGCGRCITWCPVGIDITAEVRALRAHGARADA